jgi:hypothetical protein
LSAFAGYRGNRDDCGMFGCKSGGCWRMKYFTIALLLVTGLFAIAFPQVIGKLVSFRADWFGVFLIVGAVWVAVFERD